MVEVIHNPRERVESTDGVPSKEEEERYQKLLQENDDMQRLIAEKEEKIRLLKSKLQERAALKNREPANENHVAVATSSDSTPNQPRARIGTRPAVRIVTPNVPIQEDNKSVSMEPRISFDISESYL